LKYAGCRGVIADRFTHFYGLRERGQQKCSGGHPPNSPPGANTALTGSPFGSTRLLADKRVKIPAMQQATRLAGRFDSADQADREVTWSSHAFIHGNDS